MKSMQQVIRRNLIGLSLAILTAVILLTNLGILWMFGGYLNQVKSETDQSIVQMVGEILDDGVMDMAERMVLIRAANQYDLRLRIYDAQGQSLYDSADGAMGMGAMMGRRQVLQEKAVLNYTRYEIEASSDDAVLEIGRRKGLLKSATDRSFVVRMNIVYILTAVIALMLVWSLSRKMATRLSKPIEDIQEAAMNIKKGHYKAVRMERSGPMEIDRLSETIEDVAKQLEQQESIRKRMTSDIAHEMRSPLAVIRSQIEAIMDGVLEPDLERLARLNGEVMRLTKLMDDLNELSVIENRLYTPQMAEFDFSQAVRDVAENFRPIMDSKNLELRVSVQDGILVNGDLDRLKQVLNNLLSNAYKYTNQGRITIELQGSGKGFILRIKDTGIGIAPENLPYIFERFYRVDPSRNRESGGAGIGLAIVKEILAAHEMEIQVRSEVGKGSVFILTQGQ